MRKDFPAERFNEANAEKAFAKLAQDPDFDIVRWAILSRYADIRNIFSYTNDGNAVCRAVGKLQELEWVLERFGEPPYGGLPLADGTSDEGNAQDLGALAPEIGGGYPGGSGSRPPL